MAQTDHETGATPWLAGLLVALVLVVAGMAVFVVRGEARGFKRQDLPVPSIMKNPLPDPSPMPRPTPAGGLGEGQGPPAP